ncbi:U6 small nuclear RNA (adenine-(43)-N(6))-methyltransferase [Tribolium castaneum]|uniref:U6 small nuclear RNA (adenine-(43)-N(6))-methyltransferase n=1 Tax=Tribolium castaneum TaxID=7070 RepID=D7ELH7_TRICA|nr:PREDICTED: methyltransferase-like protein 16 homolog [Tribolium castaneum]EFA12179.1 Methyltransferase-like protein 16 homolog [Tribolium castaneum]|eukprot:XP_973052.1 PREDICTED: methyltransferase-like protein 16 homolog [Tribolium castaneum]
MSMNQYMHPRNIYKQPPNFKQLALDYPEFRKYATQDVSGKVTIDFKNVGALRALTCTLLKKDFDLNIEIPPGKLIPTIPLRLNYILWLEDLLNLAGGPPQARGIDIGTGASCIYPLLAARKSQWSMVATEIDPESLKCATANVANNHLEGLVTVMGAQKDSLLAQVLEKFPGDFDFCMCNPPFFSTPLELHPFFKARKVKRPHPKNAFCASVDEVVATGGEVSYISRLVEESKAWGPRVAIYTSMVGHKSSLPPLKKLIREVGAVSFKQTEFCQGHTTRWGLAWTFRDVDLTKIPDSLISAKQKMAKPLLYQIPKGEDSKYKVSVVCERLVGVFKELQFDFQEIKRVRGLVEFVVVAFADTWSHQRRKRREKLRFSDGGRKCDNNNLDSPERGDVCEKLAELGVGGSPSSKRALEEDCGFYNAKKRKTESDDCNSEKIYLKAKISVARVGDCIGLELVFFEGKGTKEALHQVLQFIKNNLMKD